MQTATTWEDLHEQIITPVVNTHVRRGSNPARMAAAIYRALDGEGFAVDEPGILYAIDELMHDYHSAQDIVDAVIEAEVVR